MPSASTTSNTSNERLQASCASSMPPNKTSPTVTSHGRSGVPFGSSGLGSASSYGVRSSLLFKSACSGRPPPMTCGRSTPSSTRSIADGCETSIDTSMKMTKGNALLMPSSRRLKPERLYGTN